MRWTLILALLGGLYALAALAAPSKLIEYKKKGFTGELVEITVQASPNVKAHVYHGRQHIGLTPLRFQWPKDSGPLDLVVKRNGYITVNTRAYTYRNERLVVELTKEENAKTLFGYKEKLPPDGGVDAAPSEEDAPPAAP
ncbi:hypothetical protein KKF91_13320 [Myxococcota bacterium]|nr:hypothetical protein [Myxococcota bacterium]MBU1431517.1 hypothetical protein [Myxococcota bacterium]MBU1898170.1 hypothetical protein [Myxococcota bacterium]